MRFCEACGYDLVSGQAAAQGPMGVAAEPDGPRSPLLWLVVVLWAILTVAGLIWLYSRAILL